MKRSSRNLTLEARKRVVALALTWDGARWPVRSLPKEARVFLKGKANKASAPTAKSASTLFADNQVREIRICWVPQLKGGDEVLSEPFFSVDGKRVAFNRVKTTRFGDVLGVAYRR